MAATPQATLRRRDWRDIRVGVAVVAAGLVVILAATLLHLERFHWKVEAGAEFAVTQPVFDPEELCRFL